MTTYVTRTQDGDDLVGLQTDGTAKAWLDRSTGLLHVAETDSLGRVKAKGMHGSVGYDPLLAPPVFVVLDEEEREVHREEVPERGTADPSTVLMPDETEGDGSAEQLTR